MTLIGYEFRKTLYKKIILVFLLLFTIVNSYKIYEGGNKKPADIGYKNYNRGFEEAFQKIYPKIQGEMSQEKIDFIIAEKNRLGTLVANKEYDTQNINPDTYTGYIFGDYNFFYDVVYKQYNYTFTYPNTIVEVYNKASENIEFFKKYNNAFEVDKNTKIKTLLFNREIKEFKNVQNYPLIFEYQFSSLLIMLMIILVCSPIFSEEYATGVSRLIKVSNRQSSIYFSKQIVAAVFTFAITLWFFLSDFITFKIIYKLDGVTNPIYSIIKYQYCPINTSILGALMISFLFKLLFFMIFTQAVLLISSYAKSNVVSVGLSTLLLMLVIFINDIVPARVNPVGLIVSDNYFEIFDYVNVFDRAVMSLSFTVIISVLLLALLFVCNTARRRKI